jgi:hypothetical protein
MQAMGWPHSTQMTSALLALLTDTLLPWWTTAPADAPPPEDGALAGGRVAIETIESRLSTAPNTLSSL